MRLIGLVLLVLLVLLGGFFPVAGPARAAEAVTVFAAASLRGALDAVADAWRAKGGHEARLVYAGSSALARQIEDGAPADLFISANPQWMDFLAERGRLAPGSRTDLLGNRLVLVADRPGAVDLGSLPEAVGGERIAMGIVDAVPAGIYGKAALVSLGAWPALAGQVVQAENVRAALALVDRGEAPFGIVYATDAALAPDVFVVAEFPEESHPPIVYPAAVLADAGPAARELLAFLRSPTAQAIFEAHGFRPLQ